jgi:hypothetical protein
VKNSPLLGKKQENVTLPMLIDTNWHVAYGKEGVFVLPLFTKQGLYQV